MITSAHEFIWLRKSREPEEYARAASEEAPLEVWHQVIAECPAMRSWVAHNKTVSLEILEILATDADVDVRYTVARKRKISEAIAIQLAADPDETVRAALACNRKLSQIPLGILRLDSSALVQHALKARDENV